MQQEYLKTRLNYDRLTGDFTWKIPSKRTAQKPGDKAGCYTNKRLQITLDGEKYYGYQLAWLYEYGYLPKKPIRFLNGNSLDIRIDNLTIEDKITEITQEELKKFFYYDEITGNFTRLIATASIATVGSVAGSIHKKDGYVRVIINGNSYSAHILAWIYMTGSYPEKGYEIDHIDNNRANNAWCNLRLATRNQNQHNASLRKDNKSGVKGLYINGSKLEARVAVEGRTYYKTFKLDEKEKAIAWLEETRNNLHGNFKNNG